jgi:prepilin-type N-terminal cleavage/methylation domain-containing protein
LSSKINILIKKMQNKKNQSSPKKGFTLIELVVVIGILAVLLTIVLVAINPARQFSQANDTKRRSDVSAILNAVSQFAAENNGDLPANIDTTAKEITGVAGGADICTDLVDDYISALPQDPDTGTGDQTLCTAGTYATGYDIVRDANGRVTVSAPAAELGAISITR